MSSAEVVCPHLVATIHARLLGFRSPGEAGCDTNRSINNDEVSRAIDYLAALYIALADTTGMAVWPDMLPNLGWPGRLLHQVFCRQPGMWRALRLRVAAAQPKYAYPNPLTENQVSLASQQELFVYRSLRRLSGITCIDVHPYLPDGLFASKADFHLTAADRTVYVEVVMVSSNADADTVVCVEYRDRLFRKLDAYQRLGLCPVVIWADQAACPRALATRLNDALALLGLPTRMPAPLAWYELPRDVPLWTGARVPRPGRDSFGGLAS